MKSEYAHLITRARSAISRWRRESTLVDTFEADAARANQQRILGALGRTAPDGEKPAAAPPVEPKETP